MKDHCSREALLHFSYRSFYQLIKNRWRPFYTIRFSVHGILPEYRRGCHFLLQGIFPTQGSNPGFSHLLHRRWVLYHLGSHRHWYQPVTSQGWDVRLHLFIVEICSHLFIMNFDSVMFIQISREMRTGLETRDDLRLFPGRAGWVVQTRQSLFTGPACVCAHDKQEGHHGYERAPRQVAGTSSISVSGPVFLWRDAHGLGFQGR